MDLNWFQLGPLPANQILGQYNYSLVILSYVIAVLASYVALDLAARLRAETNPRIQRYWLLGGAFAMGAGIWSMHFIGMLAFIMPTPMSYAWSWTIASLFVAILASLLALYLLKNKDRPAYHMIIGGIFMGLGINAMHYMGMTGMTTHVVIRYLPSLFFLSIIIAIVASEAALWLAMHSSHGSVRRQFNYKLLSAFVMGAAICGMHYTGMAAAVFTPLEGGHDWGEAELNPYILSYSVAIITMLIIFLALTISVYYRQMMATVQNKKEFLDAVLNNMTDGIIAVNADGKVTVCNQGISKATKITKGTSYTTLNDYFQLRLPRTDTLVEITNTPLHYALQGQYIRNQEYNLVYPNHERRDVIVDGQPIINHQGERLGAVIIIRDVTDLKKTEKMKQEFVSIVSHELRTPLTSIRGSLSLLLGESKEKIPEKMIKLLEIANNNTERLIRLINDILDVEKIEAGKMDFVLVATDIVKVIENAINDVKALAEKNQIEIIFEYFGEATVNGDYDKLVQVMVNLLSNAIRFSPPGETVTVNILPGDDSLRVSVLDHGPGIPDEFKSRIFSKFSQADSSSARKKGGTGLGLSITKAIIEKHGGNINFESVPNEFTNFYFDLPQVDAESSEKKATPTTTEPAKLLICDSNPDSAELLQRFLQQHNINADLALSASEARTLVKKHPYKVIAIDLVLQDYDGIKLIKELRHDKTTADIEIIVISTQTNQAKEEFTAAAIPIVTWLEKPLQAKQLNKLLEYVRAEFQTTLPKVLCVEDDPDISQIIQELLLQEAKVVTAFTVASARKELETNPFDLIILDLKLPDGLGTDLLPSINIKTKKIIPVVVFSAYELDKKYAHLVKQALLKSRVTNEELLNILKNALHNV